MKTRRIAGFLWATLLSVCAMFQSAAAAQLNAAPADQVMVQETPALTGPFTVQATLRIPETDNLALDGIWAVGLSSAPNALPTTLSVAWIQESNSWFGPVWQIRLATDMNSAPPDLFSGKGVGILQGQRYLTLASAVPEAGHVYRFTLAYDATTGATSVVVHDNTTGEVIVNRGLQLPAFTGPLYASAGIRLPAEAEAAQPTPVVESLQAFPYFTPAEVTWSLVELNAKNQTVPVSVVNRTKDVRLLVRMPWKQLTGDLSFVIQDKVGNRKAVRIPNPTVETLTPLPLADLAAGTYQMALVYTANGTDTLLNERTVQVGVVTASLEGVQVRLVNDNQIAVEGDVVLQGDGAIDPASLSLNLKLEALSLLVDNVSLEGKITGTQPAAKQILNSQLPGLGVQPVRVQFAGDAELPDAPLHPYRIWRVALEPVVASDALLQATAYQNLLRIPGIESKAETKPATAIRVMTYNIHAGYGLDEALDLQRLADVMAYSGAQIIGLNEVDQATRRSGYVDQATKLANLLGMHVAYGPNIYYQGGQYGNAILSRFPIVSVENISLPGTNGEKRGVLHAQIDCDGVLIHYLVTHLGLTAEENTLQLRYINKLVGELSGPVVLVGDFNMTAGTDADPGPYVQQYLRDAWQTAANLNMNGKARPASFGKTFSSLTPQRRIDYIFISQELEVPTPEGVFTIDSQASDHRPLVADLRFKSK